MRAFLILIILAASVISLPAQVQQLDQQDENEIRSLMLSQEKDWNNGDIDSFMEGYWKSDQLVFVGGSGATYGWEKTRSGYHQRYPDRTAMGTLTFTILRMDALGPDHARVLGKYHLSRTIGDASGTFTLLFFRFPDGWKIISDHTSSE